MKTREQFKLLAEAYRNEVRWRGWLLFVVMFLAFIAWLSLAGLMGGYLGHESTLVWMAIALFLVTTAGLAFYQVKSQESLARKHDLFCLACSHVVGLADFKIAMATQNCPYCGARIFS